MPREVDECSYICDCGHRSDFFPRTIRDLKQMSMRRPQELSNSSRKNEHSIVFKGGRMVSIICPKLGETTCGKKGQKSRDTRKPAGGAAAKKRTSKPTAALKPSAKLTTAVLDELVEEATVDAYDTEQQVSGFFCVMDEDLKFPFETTVLGVSVIVETIEQTQNNDLVVVCRAGKHRQRIRLVDLPLPTPEPKGSKWIAAYRHWQHEGGGSGDDEE